MDSSGIKAGEQENPDLFGSGASAGSPSVGHQEVPEYINAAMQEGRGSPQALFRKIGHLLRHRGASEGLARDARSNDSLNPLSSSDNTVALFSDDPSIDFSSLMA